MKKIFLLMCLCMLPAVSLAETVTVNSANVPFQPMKNNSKVKLIVPNDTKLEKISSDGEWYCVKYNGESGWINRAYTVEGANEIKKEASSASNKNTSNKNTSTSTSNKNTSSTVLGAANSSNTKASAAASQSTMIKIVNSAIKYGKQYDVDPLLILAIIKVESDFDPKSHSSANCRGLMQISYLYAPEWGISRSRLYEVEYNIQHGTRLFKTLFLKEMGNNFDALRAYNQGITGARKKSSNGYAYASKIMNVYKGYKKNGFTYSSAV